MFLDNDKEAAECWDRYTRKVLDVLEKAGLPLQTQEDVQLDQDELSLKYSAKKATILLAPVSGQFPPLPLPTISFISVLLKTVYDHRKSVVMVCV